MPTRSVPTIIAAEIGCAVSTSQMISPDWTMTSVQNQKLSLVKISLSVEKPAFRANGADADPDHDTWNFQKDSFFVAARRKFGEGPKRVFQFVLPVMPLG
ncbi:MAG: hypothetical protein HQ518_02910 [Rhodopirellula sp.]|nr:hypothetical protein [Rhodopirellula sp.]